MTFLIHIIYFVSCHLQARPVTVYSVINFFILTTHIGADKFITILYIKVIDAVIHNRQLSVIRRTVIWHFIDILFIISLQIHLCNTNSLCGATIHIRYNFIFDIINLVFINDWTLSPAKCLISTSICFHSANLIFLHFGSIKQIFGKI